MLSSGLILLVAATVCLAGPSSVVRPCKLNDLKCIRDNLGANSKCNPKVYGSIPGQYTIKKFRFDTPFFNSTYYDNNLIIRNHDKCVVSEFFFNVKADTAVLGIDCPQLGFESNRTLVQHNSLQEDTAYHYHIKGTYPLIRLTTNLPQANVIDLCSAFTFADVTALPVFHIDALDKPTENFLTRDLTLLNVYERETFYFRAPQLARSFINLLICDFGCDF